MSSVKVKEQWKDKLKSTHIQFKCNRLLKYNRESFHFPQQPDFIIHKNSHRVMQHISAYFPKYFIQINDYFVINVFSIAYVKETFRFWMVKFFKKYSDEDMLDEAWKNFHASSTIICCVTWTSWKTLSYSKISCWLPLLRKRISCSNMSFNKISCSSYASHHKSFSRFHKFVR